MLDLSVLLNETDDVAARLGSKGLDQETVYAARDAAVRRRELRKRLDDLRADMNRGSKELGRIISSQPENAEQARAQLSALKQEITTLEEDHRVAETEERDLLLVLPNLPDPKAPIGADESANVVLRYGGPTATPVPGARPHWDVAADLGIFDVERAAKLSGSGFSLLRGDGARLLRALVQFGLDLHQDKYEEMTVPHFVRSETLVGTGHLPKFKDDAYEMRLDDLWAVPTGEVPLTGMHRGEMLDLDTLPKKYMTYTVCFRREAGSAGKDTRGMQRLHEFHKVELVRICELENVEAEFEELLADAELSLQKLGLPYRVVDLCTGDLTFSSARIFDLEVYAPGVDKWLEVSSVGSFTDFQARRSNIRYKTPDGQTRIPAYLNASAMATPRVWASIIEHGQQADGTVRVPEVLQPYLGKDVIGPHVAR
ncbi:serine--tRNA ligase [Kutzneria sp. CA-103260]|uniref:serine--tRNA ligase n=1 Tax=Kutzneria sp. CA-103260 TaxID=2802641 RepID=UPI001BAB3D32|nr:serine--tRNA ligase [Kutzneria sp. CA-103260]QUQ68841.1 serine--tRNA ligase [Kutzneria sp. CA-103260]